MDTIYYVRNQYVSQFDIDRMISEIEFSDSRPGSGKAIGVLKLPLSPLQHLWERIIKLPFSVNALLLELAWLDYPDFSYTHYGIEGFKKIFFRRGFVR